MSNRTSIFATVGILFLIAPACGSGSGSKTGGTSGAGTGGRAGSGGLAGGSGGAGARGGAAGGSAGTGVAGAGGHAGGGGLAGGSGHAGSPGGNGGGAAGQSGGGSGGTAAGGKGGTAAGGAGGAAKNGGAGGSAASDGGAPDGGTMSVAIHFKAMVGASAFACGQTYGAQGSMATTVTPKDFRFYLQDVRFINSAGDEVPLVLDNRSPWQTPDVALLDFENGSGDCIEGNPQMNSIVTGTVATGTYVGVVFTNGVPDQLDHADPLTLPAPLQVSPMTWGWLYGFKFVKAELAATGAPQGDASPGLGLLHLGSVDCNNVDGGTAQTVCGQSNRNRIKITGFDPTNTTIIADIGALFSQTDLSTDEQCHSGGSGCPSMFAAIGLDFATGAQLTTQTVYRHE